MVLGGRWLFILMRYNGVRWLFVLLTLFGIVDNHSINFL